MNTPVAARHDSTGWDQQAEPFAVVPTHVQSFRDELADGAIRAATVTLGAGAVVAAMWAFSNLLTPGATPVVATPLVASAPNVTKTSSSGPHGTGPGNRGVRVKGSLAHNAGVTTGGIRSQLTKNRSRLATELRKNSQHLNRTLARAQNRQQRTNAVRAYWASNDRAISRSDARTQKVMDNARTQWDGQKGAGHATKRAHARIQADLARQTRSVERELGRVKKRAKTDYLSSEQADQTRQQLARESVAMAARSAKRYDKYPSAKAELIKDQETANAGVAADKRIPGQRGLSRLRSTFKSAAIPAKASPYVAALPQSKLQKLRADIAGSRREAGRAQDAKAKARRDVDRLRGQVQRADISDLRNLGMLSRQLRTAEKRVKSADRRIVGAAERISRREVRLAKSVRAAAIRDRNRADRQRLDAESPGGVKSAKRRQSAAQERIDNANEALSRYSPRSKASPGAAITMGSHTTRRAAKAPVVAVGARRYDKKVRTAKKPIERELRKVRAELDRGDLSVPEIIKRAERKGDLTRRIRKMDAEIKRAHNRIVQVEGGKKGK